MVWVESKNQRNTYGDRKKYIFKTIGLFKFVHTTHSYLTLILF